MATTSRKAGTPESATPRHLAWQDSAGKYIPAGGRRNTAPAATGNDRLAVPTSDEAAILALNAEQDRRDKHRTAQLRALASELTLAQQRERRRLAEVLHDGLQQLLVGALFPVRLLERSRNKNTRKLAQEVANLIQQSIEVTRSLTGELSPPVLHQGGLVPALEWLAGWMHEKHRLVVELQADPDAGPKSEDITVLLFQAIRELLFNTVKHAQVQRAQVRVSRHGDDVEVSVCDEGIGFDVNHLRARGGKSMGFGLFSIQERVELLGGSMEIDSEPGKGSRFVLRAPLVAALRSAEDEQAAQFARRLSQRGTKAAGRTNGASALQGPQTGLVQVAQCQDQRGKASTGSNGQV